jgi:hypothetical protein
MDEVPEGLGSKEFFSYRREPAFIGAQISCCSCSQKTSIHRAARMIALSKDSDPFHVAGRLAMTAMTSSSAFL